MYICKWTGDMKGESGIEIYHSECPFVAHRETAITDHAK